MNPDLTRIFGAALVVAGMAVVVLLGTGKEANPLPYIAPIGAMILGSYIAHRAGA